MAATRKFTKDHEWVELDPASPGIATIGITDYAQKQLGDVVFVELPQPGAKYEAGQQAAVVESVKAASEVYAPIAGEVTEINAVLADTPAAVNQAADTTAWFFKLRIAKPDEIDALMDEAAYRAHSGE